MRTSGIKTLSCQPWARLQDGSGSGWSGKQNGELLELAESEFDALVTLDTNLRYQQNLAGRCMGILVLRASSNRIEDIRPLFPECLRALETSTWGRCSAALIRFSRDQWQAEWRGKAAAAEARKGVGGVRG